MSLRWRRLDAWREPGVLACIAIFLASIAAKLWWLEPVGPVVFFDELLYRHGADALATGGVYPKGHYPFVYPGVLAVALRLGGGYWAFFAANVVLSSLVIPACFLLARTLGMRHAWMAAAGAALLSLHVAFPTQVMAENLFVPAFAWATWLAVRGATPSRAGAVAFGLLLGGLFLTKYLALPALPLLWGVWLAGMAWPAADVATVPPRRGAWQVPASLSVAAAAAFVGAWLWYAHANGIPLLNALGGGVSGVANDGAVTPTLSAVGVWAVAYLAVIVLIAGPFLPSMAVALGTVLGSPLRQLRAHRVARYILLVALLTGGYWLVCIQHSAAGATNYPQPQRVVARYLMLLTPLYLVLGLVLASGPRHTLAVGWRLLAAALGVAALWLSVQVLFHDAAWDFTDWFARIPLYSSDVLWYFQPWMLGVASLLAATVLFVPGHKAARATWLLALVLLMGAALHEVDFRARRTSTVRPVHARVLAPFVLRAIQDQGSVLVIDEVREVPGQLQMGLSFWGANRKRVRVVREGNRETLGRRWSETPVLLISRSPRPGLPLQRYDDQGHAAWVIDISAADHRVDWDPAGAATLWTDRPALCPGVTDAVATVQWDAGATGVRDVEVFLVDPATGGERLFAQGNRVGSEETDAWLAPLTILRMRPSGEDRLLDQLIIGQATGCAPHDGR